MTTQVSQSQKKVDGDGEEGAEADLDNMRRDGLERIHFVAYSIGHLCNDLCAAMWFFYLSWYLNKVVKLDQTTTAACGLSG